MHIYRNPQGNPRGIMYISEILNEILKEIMDLWGILKDIHKEILKKSYRENENRPMMLIVDHLTLDTF